VNLIILIIDINTVSTLYRHDIESHLTWAGVSHIIREFLNVWRVVALHFIQFGIDQTSTFLLISFFLGALDIILHISQYMLVLNSAYEMTCLGVR